MGKIMFNYQFIAVFFMTILTQILTHYFQVSLELKQQLLLTLSCSAMSLSGVVENINFCSVAATACLPCCLETVQDFLIQLDIKPPMHILEISIFSLNHVIVRLIKIIKQPPGTSQNSYFQSHFSVSKIDRIFLKKLSMKNI